MSENTWAYLFSKFKVVKLSPLNSDDPFPGLPDYWVGYSIL